MPASWQSELPRSTGAAVEIFGEIYLKIFFAQYVGTTDRASRMAAPGMTRTTCLVSLTLGVRSPDSYLPQLHSLSPRIRAARLAVARAHGAVLSARFVADANAVAHAIELGRAVAAAYARRVDPVLDVHAPVERVHDRQRDVVDDRRPPNEPITMGSLPSGRSAPHVNRNGADPEARRGFCVSHPSSPLIFPNRYPATAPSTPIAAVSCWSVLAVKDRKTVP